MEELQDYSGEFNPDLRLADFSKEALLRLWEAGGKLYLGIDGLWYNFIREKFGEKTASEWDWEIWRRAVPLEVRRGREAMNIWGEDVASLFKYFQVDPGAGGIWPDFRCELKNNNHGILTVNHCRGLGYFERHGDMAALTNACEMDRWAFEDTAYCFNPKMKTTCLKLPPRKSKDEIACQWEFKIEE